MAQKYLPRAKTYDCEVCEEKGLNEKRNCDWKAPGECSKCGEIPFEDVSEDRTTHKLTCPICGGRVKFGHGEHVLGKSFTVPGCPKARITERAIFYIQLVNWSEEVGVLPNGKGLLDESLFYFELRNFVVSEQSIAEEEMAPKEKKKK